MCFRLPMIWTGGTNDSSNPSTFTGGNSIESEQAPTREAAIPLTGLDGLVDADEDSRILPVLTHHQWV